MIPERLTGALPNVLLSPLFHKPPSFPGPYGMHLAANRFDWDIVCVLIIRLIKIPIYYVSAPSPTPLITGLRHSYMQSFRFDWDGIRALNILWVVSMSIGSGCHVLEFPLNPYRCLVQIHTSI